MAGAPFIDPAEKGDAIMCGIFAMVDKAGLMDFDHLQKASNYLMHRGPDHQQISTLPALHLVHCRLAIFDLHPRAHQPMRRWGRTLVFNGAIYNHQSLKQELQGHYNFTTTSDTEVVLAAYDHWGIDAFSRLNGQWAMVIFDHAKEELVCVRDRFGIKPLHYIAGQFGFALASEVATFQHIPKWKPIINDVAIQHYLQGSATGQNYFENVQQVPAGSFLKYQVTKGEQQTQKYYRLPERADAGLSRPEAIIAFRELLNDAVAIRCQSDVPYCSTLSGGLDSASIAYHLLQTQPSIESYSMVFEAQKYSEEMAIVSTSKHLGLSNHLIMASFEELHTYLPLVSQRLASPAASMSILAQHHLYRRLSQDGFKVAIDGQGADEYLMGYDFFLKHYPFHLFYHPQLLLTYLSQKINHPPPKWIRPVKNQASQHQQLDPVAFCMLIDPLPSILHYLDSNSMAHGVEARVPFLDHRLVEFCRSLPTRYFMKAGRRKAILGDAMSDHLPQRLWRSRKKVPFTTPQPLWVDQHRSRLTAYIEKSLGRLESYIWPNQLNLQQLKPKPLWRLYTLVYWLQEWS